MLALGVGGLIVVKPAAADLALFATVGLVAAVALPIDLLPAVLVGGVAVISFAGDVGGAASRAVAVAGGPARFTALLAILTLLRVSYGLSRIEWRRRLVLPLLVAGVVLVDEAVVRLLTSPDDANVFRDTWQEGAYLLAGVVAYVASTQAAADPLRLYRALGVTTAALALLSLSYWAAAKGVARVPGFSNLFADVRAASIYESRAVFPFTNDSPNGSGVAFVILAAMTLPSLRQSPRRADRALAAGGLVLVLGALVATESRTALICAAAAITAYVGVHARREQRPVLIVPALIAAVAFVLVVPTFLSQERRLSLDAPTLLARKDVWQRGWELFQQEPFLGHGYAYTTTDAFLMPALSSKRPAYAIAGARAKTVGTQNEYIGQLVEGGLVAAVGVAALLAAFAVFAFQVARDADRAPPAQRGLVAAVCAVLVAMVSTQVTHSVATMTCLWLAVGLSAGAASGRTQNAHASDQAAEGR